MGNTDLWTATQRAVIIAGAMEVFFDANLDGFAGGMNRRSVKTVTPEGKTIITFDGGNYMVIDEYWTTPQSYYSSGNTTILFRTNGEWSAIWSMSYRGWYAKEVIPFLKRSLLESYHIHTVSMAGADHASMTVLATGTRTLVP